MKTSRANTVVLGTQFQRASIVALWIIIVSCGKPSETAQMYPLAGDKPNTQEERQALDLFEAYSPQIVKEQGPIMYERTILGDLNGDNADDVIVEFGIGMEGGNAVIFKQSAIYLNTGSAMKVIGEFAPNYCFSIRHISKRVVHVEELDYCMNPQPVVMRVHRYVYRSGKLVKEK